MPSILVVEQEDRYVERINGALSAEGWRVRVVPRADQAIQAAASEAPDLVLVSAEIPGAETLASSFSRSAGGPGVVGLLSETGTGAMEADDLLAKPFTDEQLRSTARRALGARRPSPPVVATRTEHKLTSQDIFGDVLAEVESDLARSSGAPVPGRPAAPPKAAPAAAEDEMQRRLEQTLSGVLRSEPKPRPAAPPPPPPPPRRPEPAANNVDALLSKTLSDLDLGRTKTGVRAPAPAAPTPPPAAKPAPAAAAPPIPPPATAPAPPPMAAPTAPPAASAAVQPPPAAPPVAAREATGVRRRVGDIDFSELEELARSKPGTSTPRPAPAPPAPRPAPQAPPARPQPPPAAAKPEPPPVTPPPVAPPPATVEPPLFDAAATQRIPLFLEEPGEQPGERFGQYTLLERIAVGGMAELWKARMRGVEGFQKTVAIKRILPHMTDNAEFVGMFIDEAKLAAQLTHPNIVHIYDLGKIGRDYYIAMEYVEGKDLRSLLNAGNRLGVRLPLELGLLIAARLASALDYAHRKRDFEDRELGLVHRDVSPQNILLTYEGDVKLCDFGIAKAAAKASQTQMGALKGKLQYMSPEQAWGRPVDARSDLFSLGAVLFEMVTGERLFPGDSEISVLDAVRQGKTRTPRQVNPAIPQEVDEIVARAIAIEPQERFQSADEMKRRIGMAISVLAPSVGPTDLAAYIQGVLEPESTEPVVAEAAPEPAAVSRVEEPEAVAPVVPFPAAAEEPVEAVAPLVEVKVEEEGRRSRTLLYAAIAALLVVAVVTFFLLNRRREAAPAPAAEASTGAPAAPRPAASPAPAQAVPPGLPAAQANAGAQMPPDVKALVEKQLAEKQAEYQRQQEEKRLKELKDLEKQVADAKKAGQPAPPPVPVETAPAQAPPAEVAPAAPEPQPQQREPEPAPAQAPPAAPPAPEPEAPRAKLGDLVTPGAGVTVPKLVSSPKPEYPPMARKLGVQGVVTVSVLVDENGQVQDVKMVEPVPQKVGINEAAMSAARAVRYQPATKDGVRVKMWTRLRIPFKQ